MSTIFIEYTFDEMRTEEDGNVILPFLAGEQFHSDTFDSDGRFMYSTWAPHNNGSQPHDLSREEVDSVHDLLHRVGR